MNMNGNKGFGLVAVLLALLAVSISAATFVVSVRWLIDDSTYANTQRRLTQLALAISSSENDSKRKERAYEQDIGTLPSALSDLISKPPAVSSCSMDMSSQKLIGWCGPYWSASYQTEDVLKDDWGNSIIFNAPGRQIRSRGKNGVDESGGGDDLAQTF